MNARVVKILVIAVAAAASAPACAGRPDGAAPLPDSRLSAIVEANRSYPRWRDFPEAPAPLPSDAALTAGTVRLAAARSAVVIETAMIDWTLSDPEGFATATRTRLDPAGAEPVSAQTAATLEAFAEALRERGRAPPPISPRQP